MPMKAKTKVNPHIAAMNAARAAKKAAERAAAAALAPAPKKRVTAQEEVKDYGSAYGDASRPIEQRRTGTQPNSRAKSAVERAQERLETRRNTPAQPPGMDVRYDADAALEDFYEDDDGDISEDEFSDEIFPSEDDLEEAQQRMSETIAKRNSKAGGTRGARMAPIGRAETGRGIQRQPIRRNDQGRVMVMNRAGRMISRTGNNGGTDKFDIPVSMIPEGWSYQWIAVSVTGKPVNNTAMLQTWEAVPSDRHDGFFMEKGHKGAIIVDDQMLCERRIELTLEARAEEIAAAKMLLRTQNEQFKPRLPDARNRRGTGLRVSRSVERLPDDIGRPDLRPDTGY